MPDAVFDLTLDHGRCVGVALPADDAAITAWAAEHLLPDECAAAAAMGLPRRRAWVGGRVALREALSRIGKTAAPILADDRGAPLLPRGVAGSISHKDRVAVALAATDDAGRVGVDVELDAPRARDIAAKVLRPEELAELEGMGADERARAVLLRFSAKEAVYKALDPYVRRYVGFHEVAVALADDGTGEVTPHLRDAGAREGPFVFEVRWARLEGLLLTTARVSLAP